MKRPSLAVIGQFILIVFGVLLIEKIARILLFEGVGERLGGGDMVVAITAAVLVTGGWLKRTDTSS